VALADDDIAKRGMRLHGVPVLGSTREIKDRGAQGRTRSSW
jgi:hypothetical protein